MVTIRGDSDYCGFFILDSGFSDEDLMYSTIEGNHIQDFCLRTPAGIALGTSDKVNLIEVNFEVFPEKPIEDEFTKWSKVCESSLKLESDTLVLCNMPDGIGCPFGSIPLASGSYNLRIYYKDEYDVREYTGNIDEYENIYEQFKIQAWLGDLIPTKVLYSRQ